MKCGIMMAAYGNFAKTDYFSRVCGGFDKS
jgi:hypothetical protein